jgi:hypothetical protein
MSPKRVGLALAWIAFAASSARAVTIDGRLDPEYGAAMSIQACATSFGDTPSGYAPFDSINAAIGSELDQGFGFIRDDVMYLFFAGNLESYVGEPLTAPGQLEVFIDCAAGGQNRLVPNNPALGQYLRLPELAGLAFDADFAPDYWIDFTCGGSGQPSTVFFAELPASGGGAGAFLGLSHGGAGALTQGVNPFGIEATINQTNRDGVPAGCGTASGSGTSAGVEWAIPLAALGNPTGPIRVCALIDGEHATGPMSNQVLGPLPAGTCSLGAPGDVDFAAIGGNQFFTLDSITRARPSSWGRLKAIYR